MKTHMLKAFKSLITISFLAILSHLSLAMEEPRGQNPGFRAKRVAHAGGGLGKMTYTNSYQALDSNIGKGFEYFEIDFVFTSDGHLVCLHDWGENFERSFDYAIGQSPTFDEFERIVAENDRFTNCTLKGLADWMSENPSAYIVTDIRDDNIRALKLIRKILPHSATRVIPQIYRAENFQAVRDMGFEQIIWTLYRLQVDDNQVLYSIRNWKHPFAITMPKKRAESYLPTLLKAWGIPTYVFTVNSPGEAEKFFNELGIAEIYTDFLVP